MKMINVKDSVRFKRITIEMLKLETVIEETWKPITGKDATMTSGNDSSHMAGSKHFEDQARDFRTKDLSEPQKDSIYQVLKNKLSPLGYDVVFEARGKVNEHLHIEYDPK